MVTGESIKETTEDMFMTFFEKRNKVSPGFSRRKPPWNVLRFETWGFMVKCDKTFDRTVGGEKDI